MGFKQGCLKPALFGCLGLIGLILVILAVTAVIALRGIDREEVGDREVVANPETVIPDAAALAEMPGRVELKLTQGEFRIFPGEPGSGVSVKARFDQNSFELVDELELLADSTWVYRVSYRRTIPFLQAIMRAVLGGESSSRVDISLPPGVPLTLVAEMHQGGGTADLGGLWLREASFELGQGDFKLDVSEPTHEPLERLEIVGSMGGLGVRNLGNASPRTVAIDWRMGGGDVDLGGSWRASADVDIKVKMGGMAVITPAEIAVEHLTPSAEAGPLQPEDPETSTPVLRLRTSANRGEIEVIRR